MCNCCLINAIINYLMALIILYCFATLLIFVKIEPFTVVGVFLSICYLPGLCLITLFKRNKILFKDLILAFPFSIGISGLLTLGVLFIGGHVKYAPVVIYIIVSIIVLSCLILKGKKKAYPVVSLSKQEIAFTIFALFMLLIMSIPYFIGPNRVGFAAHAYHHSSFVSQILNGIFPPENPGMGGTMIGYYWGFHAFIAAIASQTDFHQIQIIFALNAISLFMIFCIAYSFAKEFDLPEGYRYIMPLVVIGLIRPDIGLYFIVNLFSGSLVSLESVISQQNVFSMEVFGKLIQGLPWYDTRLLFLNKFYNISAMPTAICLCFSYLFILLIFIKNKIINHSYMIGLYTVIAACVLLYPPLAIVPLLFTPIWSLFIFISSKGNFKEKASETLTILGPYALGVLTVLPYLLFIMASRAISSGDQGGVFSIDFYSQSIKNLVVFLIPSPLILYGCWLAFKKLSFSREFFYLAIGAGLCLGLSAFTRWPFDNSYKFNYMLIIYFALFIAFALEKGLPLIASKLVRRSAAAFIILLLLMSPILIEAAYIITSLSKPRTVTFSQSHIVFAQDTKRNEAYAWIRDNTPPKSLLMLSYVETNWPCCGLGKNYEVAALTERTLYVIKDTDYTISNPEYDKRILFREKLFKNPEDPSVIEYFSALNRPVYLLVEENLNLKRFIVEERFKQFPKDFGKEFVLVFQNEKQRVYHLSLSK